MTRLPDYVGVSALGVKMGIVVPGSDIVQMVYDALVKCDADGLLDDTDTICITESVVARAQDNYVTTDDIAREARHKLGLESTSRLGVVFPLLSRNRFSMVLKGLSEAVCNADVVVQLAYPTDEVGNMLLPKEKVDKLGKADGDIITLEELGANRTCHPITGVDYISLYEQIISEQGAAPHIYLCNDPLAMIDQDVDGIVVANVHDRDQVKSKLLAAHDNCITLQDLCNSGPNAWSEWGLLGSNMSSENKLKLAPRQAGDLACQLQTMVAERLGKHVEVIIYGDGAYCDPSTGIYELADPQPTFGVTSGLDGRYRQGLKYKYIVDELWYKGSSIEDIEQVLRQRKEAGLNQEGAETEGTTPRKVEDLMASLADLVSGSSDAGTPLVLIKGFLA